MTQHVQGVLDVEGILAGHFGTIDENDDIDDQQAGILGRGELDTGLGCNIGRGCQRCTLPMELRKSGGLAALTPPFEARIVPAVDLDGQLRCSLGDLFREADETKGARIQGADDGIPLMPAFGERQADQPFGDGEVNQAVAHGQELCVHRLIGTFEFAPQPEPVAGEIQNG